MTEVNVAIGDGFNGYSSEDDEHTPKSKRSDVSVTVSNVPQTLFEDASSKVEFETLFLSRGDTATFFYLKSMSRVRVNYTKPESASWAVQSLRGRLVGNCYLRVSHSRHIVSRDSHLKPPKPQKQFLISPPSSPPVDWAQSRENAPLAPAINFDLLSAVAGLSDEPFELHSSSSAGQPSIMVVAPENDKEEDKKHETTDTGLLEGLAGCKIHTTRPPKPD